MFPVLVLGRPALVFIKNLTIVFTDLMWAITNRKHLSIPWYNGQTDIAHCPNQEQSKVKCKISYLPDVCWSSSEGDVQRVANHVSLSSYFLFLVTV